MIRLLRGIIYGIAAGITAAFVIDYMDNARRREEATPPFMLGKRTAENSGSAKAEGKAKVKGKAKAKRKPAVQTGDDLTDEARQALLDELGAQLQ